MGMPDEPRKALFEVVQDEPVKPARGDGVAMLKLALAPLSERGAAFISGLFTLVTIGSAFWLYMSIHEPNVYQLVEIAMYSVFVLSANWIVRLRRK